jgi:hypothetical protein
LLKVDIDNQDEKGDDEDDDDMSETKIFELINSASIQATSLNLVQFKKILFNDVKSLSSPSSSLASDLKSIFNKLVRLVNSNELAKFNNQIVSYMAEQLIHKAALNGHLKFACEIMRKKSSELIDGDASSVACSSDTKKNSFSLANPNLAFDNEQDEKVFKLASELLLSDEDCLRKLSSQVLNEASHLTQLNCVLNTLRKIRWKHLKCEMSSIEKLSEKDDDFESEVGRGEEEEIVELEERESNLNYILDVIRNFFVQHEFQISEQLSEVHKLMSISSDEDLLAHLQNQNFELHQELNQLKYEQQQQRNATLNNNNNNNTKRQQQQHGGVNQRSSNSKLGAISNEKNVVSIESRNQHHHHHILTGNLIDYIN